MKGSAIIVQEKEGKHFILSFMSLEEQKSKEEESRLIFSSKILTQQHFEALNSGWKSPAKGIFLEESTKEFSKLQ